MRDERSVVNECALCLVLSHNGSCRRLISYCSLCQMKRVRTPEYHHDERRRILYYTQQQYVSTGMWNKSVHKKYIRYSYPGYHFCWWVVAFFSRTAFSCCHCSCSQYCRSLIRHTLDSSRRLCFMHCACGCVSECELLHAEWKLSSRVRDNIREKKNVDSVTAGANSARQPCIGHNNGRM